MGPAHSLFEAIEYGDEPRVVHAITEAPDLVWAADRHLKTPLHVAAEHDRDRIAALLLDGGADLEAETVWGMTPLQWAANMGSGQVGRLLIARGARLNLWSAAGLGLLDAIPAFFDASDKVRPGAAQQRYEQTAAGFVKRPPTDDDRDAISDAFYIACRNGHTDVARWFLARGADVHFRGFFGGTALHWAAINGHRETVAFLLAAGARTDLKDDEFKNTPAGWAREFHHDDIAAMIER